jgi:uncharacterized protein
MSAQVSPPTTPALPASDKSIKAGRGFRRSATVLLALSMALTVGYAAVSITIASQLIQTTRIPLYATPASLGLQYKDVTFPSREDHFQLSGWFIPGVLPNGSLTAARTIIIVPGNTGNRDDTESGLLNLSGDLARRGFAVLAFDLRGSGESSPAPRSIGYFEQRDVLGAVDFLLTGSAPYPDLGRPHAIAGYGLSIGGSALILAVAHEPSIRAIVTDGTAADYLPILEQQVPKEAHLPSFFTPGALLAARAIYGIDFYNVRPIDVVAQLAPRPLFFIHGAADTLVLPSNLGDLAAAARAAPDAHVETWLVPGATHAQPYHTQPHEYVDRIVAFYAAALGPDTNVSH